MYCDPDDDDESDKHLEARDRRYSCLISIFKPIPKYLFCFDPSFAENSVDKL